MANANKRILVVVTSHDSLGSTGEKTGFWLEELATPYYVFRDAGHSVDLASPRGGTAPYDPKSLDREGSRPASVVRFLADKDAMAAIERTQPLASIDPSAYAAVFIAGGHGTMWDLPEDARLAAILQAIDTAGGVVSAVCHGPAGLVAAKRKDGRPLVAGRKVTGFTNQEEDAVKLTGIVPFALETRLRELGGEYVGGAMWQSHAVADGNLVTGQNPASSEKVARLVLERLA
jgi:putative intracellular protease/amidase